MQTSIVQIGNSRGIRIPKAILERCGLPEKVELIARRGQLMVRPARHSRAGWEEAFRRMAAHGDDRLLDTGAHRETRWDRAEWEW